MLLGSGHEQRHRAPLPAKGNGLRYSRPQLLVVRPDEFLFAEAAIARLAWGDPESSAGEGSCVPLNEFRLILRPPVRVEEYKCGKLHTHEEADVRDGTCAEPVLVLNGSNAAQLLERDCQGFAFRVRQARQWNLSVTSDVLQLLSGRHFCPVLAKLPDSVGRQVRESSIKLNWIRRRGFLLMILTSHASFVADSMPADAECLEAHVGLRPSI